MLYQLYLGLEMATNTVMIDETRKACPGPHYFKGFRRYKRPNYFTEFFIFYYKLGYIIFKILLSAYVI